MKHRGLAFGLGLCAGLAAWLLFPRQDATDQWRSQFALESPEYLPTTARFLLARQMHHHGADMLALFATVLRLDYAGAQALAQEVSESPRFAQPTSEDATELNALLPPSFFLLQDSLRKNADNVVTAARRRNARELHDAFGELSMTCVGCHAVYLERAEMRPGNDDAPSGVGP